MLTGDASINPDAPIVCCTAEVLANMALRQGADAAAPYVVMDEFHYYADRERGMAWQIPLLALPRTQFLLMSATLGDTARSGATSRRAAGREVAHVALRRAARCRSTSSTARRRCTRRSRDLLEDGHAPIYVVNFTQREARSWRRPDQRARRDARGARADRARRSATFASTRPTARICAPSAPASASTTRACCPSTGCWSSSSRSRGCCT